MKKKFIYPALVVKEAKSLRELTTPKEKENLNLTINPEDSRKCIYGRLCGSCFEPRAIELIESSCSRVYNPSEEDNTLDKPKLNGSPKKKYRSWTSPAYWSPIEVFIYKYRNDYSKIDKLAKFIQGKVKTL